MCGNRLGITTLSKLREMIRFQKAVTQVVEVIGEEPPEFEDHTPFSNRGMKDLLELDELVSTIQTEVIPLWSNKTIKAHTPLVLMEVRVNVITEPLPRDDEALPRGLHVRPSYSTYHCGS